MPFEKMKRGLDALIDRGISDSSFPGAVAMVSIGDKVVYSHAAGFAMKVPEERKISINSVFDLASLTKVVATTPCILQLVDEGLLSLSDNVSSYFGEYDWSNGNSKATIEDLLCHTSGFPAYYPFHKMGKNSGSGEKGYTGIIETISALPPLYEPGKGEIYSDIDFILLGKIAEKITGRTLDAYCRERIFSILGMTETMFNPPQSLKRRFVATEIYKDRVSMGTVHDENAYYMGGISGHAGLFSTASDLQKYCAAMLNAGKFRKMNIISTRIAAEMIRQRRPGINGSYGLGWQLNNGRYVGPFGDLFPLWSFGHTGFTGTMIWMDSGSGVASILLTNRVHPDRTNNSILRYRRLFNNIVASNLISR
jgi:CubicO group peptidase (beta-lactamase class C family)